MNSLETRMSGLEREVRTNRFCIYAIALTLVITSFASGCQGPGHYRVGEYTVSITAPPTHKTHLCLLCSRHWQVPRFSGVPEKHNRRIEKLESQKHYEKYHGVKVVARKPEEPYRLPLNPREDFLIGEE